MNKYRIISLEPIPPPFTTKTVHPLPQIRPRTLSLRCQPKNLQLQCLTPINPLVVDAKKYSRKASSLNLKQRPHLVQRKRSKKSELVSFDNRIFCKERARVKKSNELPGLSRADLVQRKESHLNTYFNNRKNRLKEITKENKNIYVRINSQKSLYSSRQLNKSTDQINQSRLSRKSKLSVSSSRKTNHSKADPKRVNIVQKKQPQIKIQSKNIKKLQNSEVNCYLNIFCNHLNNSSKPLEQKLAPKQQNLNGKQNIGSAASGLERILQELEHKNFPKKTQKMGRLL